VAKRLAACLIRTFEPFAHWLEIRHLTEYSDAQHGFDAGLLGNHSVIEAPTSQTVRHCHIREGDGGVLMNADIGATFSHKDACVRMSAATRSLRSKRARR
jgi:hypothetical protein